MQSIKGLEADTIIIHSFVAFMHTTLKHEKELFWQKIYILLTHARERVII
ncbi:hypothetical protein [Campylobacter sp. 19-13652]|nr:hypothetical protein [Campylobacter sp. 19-13652]BCX78588.1 hypothetical protein LBC_00500 [Campylobacter sp. 19-13652]